jgi:hypothetical protein
MKWKIEAEEKNEHSLYYTEDRKYKIRYYRILEAWVVSEQNVEGGKAFTTLVNAQTHVMKLCGWQEKAGQRFKRSFRKLVLR